MRAASTAAAFCLPVLLLGQEAAAQAVPIPVTVTQCPWLKAPLLVRLTRLELGSDVALRAAVAVAYRCADKAVEIALSQPPNGMRVSRRIDSACCDDPAKERTLALLALGLLRSSRSLLNAARAGAAGAVGLPLKQVKPLPPQAATKASTTSAAVRGTPAAAKSDNVSVAASAKAASRQSSTVPPTAAVARSQDKKDTIQPEFPASSAGERGVLQEQLRSYRHRLGLGAQVALHHPAQPVSLNGFNVSYVAWPWRLLGFGAEFAASFGRLSRRGGEVDARLLSFNALSEWRFFERNSFRLSSAATAGVAWLHLSGDAKQSDVEGASIQGATASLAASLVPAFRTGRSALRVPLKLGYVFRAPRGTVAGDEAVRVDGLFVGLGLDVRMGFVDVAPMARPQQRRMRP